MDGIERSLQQVITLASHLKGWEVFQRKMMRKEPFIGIVRMIAVPQTEVMKFADKQIAALRKAEMASFDIPRAIAAWEVLQKIYRTEV